MAMKPPVQPDSDDVPGQVEPGEGMPQEEAQDSQMSRRPPGKKNANPTQRIYNLVIAAALKMIFDEKAFPIVAQKLVSSGMPVPRVIGHTAAMVLLSVSRGLGQQGVQVPPQILMQAGKELVANLSQVAVGLNLVPANAIQKVSNAAMMYGLQDFQNWMQQTGKISPAMQQQAGLRLSKQGYQPPQQQAGQQQQAVPGGPQPQGAPAGGPPGVAAGGPPGVVSSAMQR